MNQEDFKKYEKHLQKFNEEELEKREIYLKQLADGVIQGPQVGYSSADKPYLRYTDVKQMQANRRREKRTIYQEILEVNKDNLDHMALVYFGTKVTYRKLFENIDKAAKPLIKMGVKKGDKVTICSTATPELIYLVYAISKIGAVANFIPPYFKPKDIADRINDCKSEHLFVLDKCYDLMKDIVPKTGIKNTVIMPFFNSFPMKYVKPEKKIKGEKYWNNFIEDGKNVDEVQTEPYEKDMPLALIYSSGSTGDAKSILLTNDSFQESVHSYDACAISMDKNQIFYQLIPPWVSTGLSTSIHLPLSKGATVFMDPRFDKKIFVKNIIKHKINATVATASMYDGFLEEKLSKRADLSHFTNAFEGGEPLKKQRKENIEKVMHDHGCPSPLKIGYGQCESGSGITTQTDDFYRSDESVGIPIPGVDVKIVDENFNELPYGERGQIVARTDSAMKEYYNNPEATAKYFHEDETGRWSCTNDIGSMDSEGMVYLYGRGSDCARVNGELVYNFDLENVVISCPKLLNCAVVTSNDGIQSVHLVTKDKKLTPEKQMEVIKEIQESLFEKFDNINYVPVRYKFRNEIPISKSSKRDGLKLQAETDGYIVVDNTYLLDKNNIKKK